MYSAKPILWYDVERIMPEIRSRLEAGTYDGPIPRYDAAGRVVADYVRTGVKARPYVYAYPTPDQLFRWRPK
jgi:hypothetical protein